MDTLYWGERRLRGGGTFEETLGWQTLMLGPKTAPMSWVVLTQKEIKQSLRLIQDNSLTYMLITILFSEEIDNNYVPMQTK
jgi:hypothetical protein